VSGQIEQIKALFAKLNEELSEIEVEIVSDSELVSSIRDGREEIGSDGKRKYRVLVVDDGVPSVKNLSETIKEMDVAALEVFTEMPKFDPPYLVGRDRPVETPSMAWGGDFGKKQKGRRR
jgi:hypothetical protein